MRLLWRRREHVQRVYDSIATEWHGTRYRSWPRVEEFVLSLPRGSLIADLGCGNGKMASACRQGGHFALACDFSVELVRIAALQQGAEAQIADALLVPYRDGCFDAALSIAVLHHISTEARCAAAHASNRPTRPEPKDRAVSRVVVGRRRQLMAETLRVLRPGGLALFYAWAMEQSDGVSGHLFAAQDVFVPFHQRGHTPAKAKQPKQPKQPKRGNAAVVTTPAPASRQGLRQLRQPLVPVRRMRLSRLRRRHQPCTRGTATCIESTSSGSSRRACQVRLWCRSTTTRVITACSCERARMPSSPRSAAIVARLRRTRVRVSASILCKDLAA